MYFKYSYRVGHTRSACEVNYKFKWPAARTHRSKINCSRDFYSLE
nr:MAG TPA: hypothetical protein [Caudoviricetes sp.]